MAWLLFFIALAIGVMLPIQAGVNAELRVWAGNPIVAALISFIVGGAFLFVAILFSRSDWWAASRLSSAPRWVWFGGVLGATYVWMSVILAPRLGAATLIGLTVTGQMLASVVLDHFGLIGYSVHPASTGRIIGAVLLIAGVFLIQHF